MSKVAKSGDTKMSRRIQVEHYRRDRAQLKSILRYEIRKVQIDKGGSSLEMLPEPRKLDWERITPPLKAAYASAALMRPGYSISSFLIPFTGREFWELRSHPVGFMQAIQKAFSARLNRLDVDPKFWMCLTLKSVTGGDKRATIPIVLGCIAFPEGDGEKCATAFRSLLKALLPHEMDVRNPVRPVRNLLRFVDMATDTAEEAARILGTSEYACVREVNRRASEIYGRKELGGLLAKALLQERT